MIVDMLWFDVGVGGMEVGMLVFGIGSGWMVEMFGIGDICVIGVVLM